MSRGRDMLVTGQLSSLPHMLGTCVGDVIFAIARADPPCRPTLPVCSSKAPLLIKKNFQSYNKAYWLSFASVHSIVPSFDSQNGIPILSPPVVPRRPVRRGGGFHAGPPLDPRRLRQGRRCCPGPRRPHREVAREHGQPRQGVCQSRWPDHWCPRCLQYVPSPSSHDVRI